MSYAKYHDLWEVSDRVSGAAINHIETQWDAITADADLHTHDSRYYTKTLSDATFFTASTSYTLGMDADKLDGQHFSDLLASVMPPGAIMIWYGTDASVPAGWHICDGGTYGGLASPDLRDRFVIGAGGDYAVGATAGPATYNGTITPTGTVTVGGHQLTTTELPPHDHTFTEISPPWTGEAYHYSDSYTTPTSDYTSTARTTDAMSTGDGTHTHSGSTATLTAIDPRPKYRGLYYIMKYA